MGLYLILPRRGVTIRDFEEGQVRRTSARLTGINRQRPKGARMEWAKVHEFQPELSVSRDRGKGLEACDLRQQDWRPPVQKITSTLTKA